MTALTFEPTSRRWSGPFSDAAVRFAAVGVVAAAVSRLSWSGRPHVLCPLRALTGVPCPLCGATTAVVRLGRLDLYGALLANPFVLVAAGLLVVAPLTRHSRVPLSMRVPVVLAIVAVAWLWQLVRFGLLAP